MNNLYRELLEGVGAILEIEVLHPKDNVSNVGNLWNIKASRNAVISKVALSHPTLYSDDDCRDFTDKEMKAVAINNKEITIYSGLDTNHSMKFLADNGSSFSVKELFRCLEQFELMDRPKTEWLGGPDIHHVCLEGLTITHDWCVTPSYGS